MKFNVKEKKGIILSIVLILVMLIVFMLFIKNNDVEKDIYGNINNKEVSARNELDLEEYIRKNKSFIEDVIQPLKLNEKYDYISTLVNGFACVQKDGKWGFIDEEGQEVIPVIYFSVSSFSDGLARVSKEEGMWYINEKGKEVISFGVYNNVFGVQSSHTSPLLLVQKDGLYGYLSKTGEEIIPCIYTDASLFDDGLAYVATSYRNRNSFGRTPSDYGYIDLNGKEIIPFVYESATSFKDGIARVSKDGKYGCIDKEGNEVIPFIYDNIKEYSDGLARATKDGKWGVIDKEGKEVVSFIYDYMGRFFNGITRVQKDGKFSYIDERGKEVVPLERFNYEQGVDLKGYLLNAKEIIEKKK